MAVAVKNREAASARALGRLQAGTVAGVVYVLVALAILFPLADLVWWWLLGLPRDNPYAWLGLVVIDCALAVGFVIVGKRLLDANPVKGLKAGIFLGTVGILLLLLITDWVGVQLADAAFAHGWPPLFGIVATAAFGLVVLFLGGRYFLSDKMVPVLNAFEEQGWLSTQPYKRSQGLRVRRGTILGILLLVGCGIWVLHLTLMKQGGEAAWQVGIPFTGDVPITWASVGDDPQLKDWLENGPPGDPAVGQKAITERWRQRRDEALETLRAAGTLSPEVRERLRDIAKDKDADDVRQLLANLPRQGDDEAAAGRGTDDRKLLDALAVLREPLTGPLLYVSRFWLRDRNKQLTDPNNGSVKITDPGFDPYTNTDPAKGQTFEPLKDKGETYEVNTGPQFQPGEVVPKSEYDRERQLRQDKKDQFVEHKDKRATDPESIVPPTAEAVIPARTEPVEYAVPQGPLCPTRILLPNVAYTLPVLLGLLGLWFAWRVVNVPAFADFLVATEAELNKVSWTTRKQLWQDTVVVLSTVILMAAFLFLADVLWYRVLRAIDVLRPPEAQQKVQEQPW